MSATAERLPDGFDTRRLLRRLLILAGVIAAVAAVLMLVPGLVGVRARLAHAQGGWLAPAAGFEVLSCLAYVIAFRAAFCSRMSWRMSYRIGMSELGATALLPVGGIGGLALGVWALRRGGMPDGLIARRTVAFFLITSAINVAAVVAAGLGLALGLLPGTGRLVLSVGPVALAVAAILLVAALPVLTGRIPARWTAVAASRPLRPVARALTVTGEGVVDALSLLRSGDARLLGGAIGYLAFDIAVFYCCFRAFGPAPPTAHLVLAYLVGQLGGLIPIPGGVGGIDAGLVGALVLYGTPAATATAGVLAYRAIVLAIPSVLGVQAFVALKRSLRDEEASRVPCADDPPVVAAA